MSRFYTLAPGVGCTHDGILASLWCHLLNTVNLRWQYSEPSVRITLSRVSINKKLPEWTAFYLWLLGPDSNRQPSDYTYPTVSWRRGLYHIACSASDRGANERLLREDSLSSLWTFQASSASSLAWLRISMYTKCAFSLPDNSPRFH